MKILEIRSASFLNPSPFVPQFKKFIRKINLIELADPKTRIVDIPLQVSTIIPPESKKPGVSVRNTFPFS